jgi:hypothetical protein
MMAEKLGDRICHPERSAVSLSAELSS